MGLDWNPGNRAKPGYEAEFADVFGRIAKAEPDDPRDALLERYHQISITAFETLAAPVVGRDPEADRWALQWRADVGSDEPEAEFLAQLAGFAVLPLVPPCDGLPRYSNGSPGGYVEQYSFRAQFLHDCEDDLGEDLLASAYESKLPGDLLRYGRELLARAEDLAGRHGLDPLNLVIPESVPAVDEPDDDLDDDLDEDYDLDQDLNEDLNEDEDETWSVEHRVDVMHSAGRWCVFWAERGHILDAYW